jgi:hypothetical protein
MSSGHSRQTAATETSSPPLASDLDFAFCISLGQRFSGSRGKQEADLQKRRKLPRLSKVPVTPSVARTIAIGMPPVACQNLRLPIGSDWHREVVMFSRHSGSSGTGKKSLSPMAAIRPSPIWRQNAHSSDMKQARSVAPYVLSGSSAVVPVFDSRDLSAGVRGCPAS